MGVYEVEFRLTLQDNPTNREGLDRQLVRVAFEEGIYEPQGVVDIREGEYARAGLSLGCMLEL